MAIKISYEWCLEELEEYEEGCFDIVEPNHADLKGDQDLGWLLSTMDNAQFYFGIKKWSYDTKWGDSDWQHIYLYSDGKFSDQWSLDEFKLPKYVMELFEPHRDKILNHKNFRE